MLGGLPPDFWVNAARVEGQLDGDLVRFEVVPRARNASGATAPHISNLFQIDDVHEGRTLGARDIHPHSTFWIHEQAATGAGWTRSIHARDEILIDDRVCPCEHDFLGA